LYYRITITCNDDDDDDCDDSDDTEKKREKKPKRRDDVSWAIGEFFNFNFTLQLLTRLYYRITITCNNDNNNACDDDDDCDDNDDCNDSDDTEKKKEKKAQETSSRLLGHR
jgi:hypothetical protein